MSDSMEIEHPGAIQCVDGATQELVETLDAKQLPALHRFGRNDAGELVPVVKLVGAVERGRWVVRSYDPDGALLRTHVTTPGAT